LIDKNTSGQPAQVVSKAKFFYLVARRKGAASL